MVSGREGREGKITKGHQKILEDAGYVHYFDCGDGFMAEHQTKLRKMYTLNICGL